MFLSSLIRRRIFISVAGLLVLSLLIISAYSNTFHSPPVLDDIHSFIDEPLVENFDWSFETIKNLAGSKFGLSRFIPMLSLAHDRWRGQGEIAAFHVTNLIIHMCVTLAVFFWVKILLWFGKFRRNDYDDLSVIVVALAVAGIWSLSPIQTNAVTYIVQRMAALAALFYLISFTAYFNARKNWMLGQKHKAFLFWVLSILACLAAFLSKQNSATLPVMILIGEWLFCRRQLYDHFKRYKFFYTLLAIVILGGVIIVSITYFPSVLAGYRNRHFSMGERLLTECRVVISYISILLAPLPSRLCLDSHVSLSQSILSPITTLFSLLLIVSFLVLGWCQRIKRPLLSFLIFWFFINLMIESSFVGLELKFEHRLYLPSVSFYFILVLCFVDIARKIPRLNDRRLAIALLVLLCSVLSLMTYARNQVWNDVVSINTDNVQKAYLKPRAHSNLSGAYLRSGCYHKAIGEANKAIELGVFGYEEYWVSANNIISSFVKLGDNDRACREGEKLLANAPDGVKLNSLPIFYYNLAACYLRAKKYNSAFNMIVSSNNLIRRANQSYMLDTEEMLLTIFKQAGLHGNEEELVDLGLKGRDDKWIFVRMTEFFLDLPDLRKAEKYSQKALSSDSECLPCQQNFKKTKKMIKNNTRQLSYGTLKSNYISKFWYNSFNFSMAVAYIIEKNNLSLNNLRNYCIEWAKAQRPKSLDVWLLSSWHCYSVGNYDQAIQKIENALAIDASYAQLWVNLGMYQLASGKLVAARQSLLKALELYPGYPKKNYVLTMLAATKSGISGVVDSGKFDK